MDRLVPLQEPPARAMDLTGILIGGGVLVRLVDGVMGLVQVGPRMGSVRVSGMDQALEAGGQARDTVMGLGVVVLKVVGLVLEVGPVVPLVVAEVEEMVDRVALEHTHLLILDRKPTMGEEGAGFKSMCANVILDYVSCFTLLIYI